MKASKTVWFMLAIAAVILVAAWIVVREKPELSLNKTGIDNNSPRDEAGNPFWKLPRQLRGESEKPQPEAVLPKATPVSVKKPQAMRSPAKLAGVKTIAELRVAIPELEEEPTAASSTSNGFWYYDQDVVPVELDGLHGKSAVFPSARISVTSIKQTGRVEICTFFGEDHDISTLQAEGTRLHQLLGRDERPFIEWCKQVGNQWLDAPLYTMGRVRVGDLSYSLATLRGPVRDFVCEA